MARLSPSSIIAGPILAGMTLLAPLGVFRFSYAYPLNAKRGDTATRWGDEVEGFQFSIGQAF